MVAKSTGVEARSSREPSRDDFSAPLCSRNTRDPKDLRGRGVRTRAPETQLIAFVVGSWLNLFNHGDELLLGVITAHLAAKLALNYLTPFIVSNAGMVAYRRH